MTVTSWRTTTKFFGLLISSIYSTKVKMLNLIHLNTCENSEKDCDQHLGAAHSKCWSKYATNVTMPWVFWLEIFWDLFIFVIKKKSCQNFNLVFILWFGSCVVFLINFVISRVLQMGNLCYQSKSLAFCFCRKKIIRFLKRQETLTKLIFPSFCIAKEIY